MTINLRKALARRRLELVDDWRRSWRWASVRLALVAGAAAAWAATDPTAFAQAVALLPDWSRPLIGLAVAGSAIGTRLVRKGGGDA